MGNKLRKLKESIVNPNSQSGLGSSPLDSSAGATAQEGRYTPLGDSSAPNSVTETGKTSDTPANGGASGLSGGGGGGGESPAAAVSSDTTGVTSAANLPSEPSATPAAVAGAADPAHSQPQLSVSEEGRAKAETVGLASSASSAGNDVESNSNVTVLDASEVGQL